MFANRSRPCLLHQIQRCSAPCVELIDARCYAQDIDRAVRFLARATERNHGASSKRGCSSCRSELKFEQAAAVRDQIGRAGAECCISRRSKPARSDADADVLAVVADAGSACVNLAMIRGGRHLGDKRHFPARAGDGSGSARNAGSVHLAALCRRSLCPRHWWSTPTSMPTSSSAMLSAASGTAQFSSVRHPQEAAAALAGDGRSQRAARAGAPPGGRRVAAGAHAGVGRRTRPGARRRRRPTSCASNASTSATRRARRRRRRASCTPSTRCGHRRIPALQHRRRRGGRRLRSDAAGADATLRTGVARRRPAAAPGAGRRRKGQVCRGAAGVRRTGSGSVGACRRGEGRRAQGGTGRARVSRRSGRR